MSGIPHDAAMLRLQQLQGQAGALRESLALHKDVMTLESDDAEVPAWLRGLAAEVFWEASRLLPDDQYFQHAAACGLDFSTREKLREQIASLFDCDAFLAMMQAAASQYTGVAPPIGFHALRD